MSSKINFVFHGPRGRIVSSLPWSGVNYKRSVAYKNAVARKDKPAGVNYLTIRNAETGRILETVC